jgi:hypothetical protein
MAIKPKRIAGPLPELSPEDKERLRIEAQAEAENELLEEARKQYKAAAKAVALEDLGIKAVAPAEEEMVEHTVDIGPSGPGVRIDGKWFQHGNTYTVPLGLRRTLLEIEHRTWRHEDSISDGGARENAYRRAGITTLRGRRAA